MRLARLGGFALICALATGCDTSTASPASVSAAPPTAATSADPASGGPSVPAPSIVETEAGSARETTAAIDGSASVSAASIDGATYTLSVPAGAVPAGTAIGLHPVAALHNLPAGASLTAGVQFSPDGLQLDLPATLIIQLPSGTAASGLIGLAWRGDGDREHYYPALIDGDVITFSIPHFSGAGLLPAQPALPPLPPCVGVVQCTEAQQAALAMRIGQRAGAAELLASLRTWYRDVVEPALAESFDPVDFWPRADAYDAWLAAIGVVRQVLHDPTFSVTPETRQSKTLAAGFLRAAYDGYNRMCFINKDLHLWQVPVSDAVTALVAAARRAIEWSINTPANRLDMTSLLTRLCAKVVIIPRRFSANGPGDRGVLVVKAGVSIAGGPMHTGAGAVHVAIALRGSSDPAFEGDTDASGNVETSQTWPGIDPLTIDITAAYLDVTALGTVRSDLKATDRVTQRAQKLSFTFDHGFEGWLTGRSGPEGTTNWGLVDWLSFAGDGVVHMDGRGNPSRPNAWIYQSFELPETTKTLSFDVSAEIIKGSSSLVRVRIVSGGVSTPMPWVSLHNATSHLSFSRVTVNISPWAGRHVTIYIEQNDNTPAGATGFDKEIYVDNVRIGTS
jgi:hypothetical protein